MRKKKIGEGTGRKRKGKIEMGRKEKSMKRERGDSRGKRGKRIIQWK